MSAPKKVKTLRVGAKVSIKPERLDGFIASVRGKLKDGRTGFVRTHSYPSRYPLIMFPAVGRKKEYSFGAASHWQIDFNFDPADVIEMEVAQ